MKGYNAKEQEGNSNGYPRTRGINETVTTHNSKCHIALLHPSTLDGRNLLAFKWIHTALVFLETDRVALQRT